MSPHSARVRTLYALIAFNVLLAFCLGGAALYTRSVQTRVSAAEERSYQACERGNVLREIARYAMVRLGSPDRAAKPEVAEQPCAELYPGGK